MLERIPDGRTDLVFEYVSEGHPSTSRTKDDTSLIQLCAYYGDVSAICFLRLLSNLTGARSCLSAYEWTRSSETAALALIDELKIYRGSSCSVGK